MSSLTSLLDYNPSGVQLKFFFFLIRTLNVSKLLDRQDGEASSIKSTVFGL